MCKIFDYLNKYKEKIFAMLLLSVLICLVQLSYIQSAIPPQVGWWNYYGWQISEGKLLYKDIYCFLMPYFVWIMEYLYDILGINLIYFQIIGIILNIISVLMIYILFSNVLSCSTTMVVCFVGAVLSYSYIVYFPFDYNQINNFFVISAIFFAIYGTFRNKGIYYILYGLFTGLFAMTKHTGVIFCIFSFMVLTYNIYNFFDLKHVIKFLKYAILGIFIAVVPGLVYLIYTNTLIIFLNQVFLAGGAKGPLSNVLVRFYQFGFSYLEFIFALTVVISLFCRKNLKFYYQKYLGRTGVTFEFFILNIVALMLLFKLLSLYIYSTGIAINVKFFFIFSCGIFIFIALLFEFKSKEYFFSKNIEFRINGSLKIFFYFLLIVCFLMIIENNFFEFRENVFFIGKDLGYLYSVKRFLVNISFWISLLSVSYNFYAIIFRKNEIMDQKIFLFMSLYLGYISMNILSSVIEEVYIFPVFTFSFYLVLKKLNFTFTKVFLVIISVFVIIVTITQKQVMPYSWHGWQMKGLKNTGVQYIATDINGLNGYILDVETENAYKNIIKAIEENSNSNDIVYQFPHIPLFNVLTRREIGTFAVVHYFDVTPDYIAKNDGEKLFNNPPKMVIWNEFGDDLWNFHELYFRGGKPSGQRKIREFYENVVKKKYKLVYSYKNIYVWVRGFNCEKGKV